MTMSPLIEKLFQARGIDLQEQNRLLDFRLGQLHDPFVILNMRLAAERLVHAFQKKEKILLYADFDMDGTPGLALFYKGLTDLGFTELEYFQPRRMRDGYGFHANKLDLFKSQNIDLIVTIDLGITAVEACARAAELGIEVIITDHHQPAEQLPVAFAVVNPNQKGDVSGLNYLCGAGVAFYLLRAVATLLKEKNLGNKIDLKKYLDFLALATVSDMVPLVGDNRILVKHGMKAISNTENPGLRAFLKNIQMYGETISSSDIGMKIAPPFNALSRLDQDLLPLDLFLAEQEDADFLAGQVVLANDTRKQIQKQSETLAFELSEQKSQSGFAFVADEKFHRGVVGLIATKLAQKKNVPSFVCAWDEHQKTWVGSARVPANSSVSLTGFLEAHTEYFVKHGGHKQAAGFEIKPESMEKLEAAMSRFFSNITHTELDFEEFDTEAEIDEVNESTLNWLEQLQPFGIGFKTPIFRFTKVILKQIKALRGGHWRFEMLQASSATKLTAILFSAPGEVNEFLQASINMASPPQISIRGELQWNVFAGQKKIQVLVKSLELPK